jgi:hypothetical protein
MNIKGKLISVNGVPHVYSDFIGEAFELPLQDRAELKDNWQGCNVEFDLDRNIKPGSIVKKETPESGESQPWLSVYLNFLRSSKKLDLVGFYDYLEANYELPIKK